MQRKFLLYAGLCATFLSGTADLLHAADTDHAVVASYGRAKPALAPAAPAPAALRKMLHSPEFNVRDPLDEFSGRDWNDFVPLGGVITHEMREAKERAAAEVITEPETKARGLR